MKCSELSFDTFIGELSHDELLSQLQGFSFCGQCKSCLSIFIMTAPLLSEAELVSLFGGNLLDRKELQIVFDELVGFKRVLHPNLNRMRTLNKILPLIRPKFANSVLMKHYVNETLKQCENDLFEDYFNMSMT